MKNQTVNFEKKKKKSKILKQNGKFEKKKIGDLKLNCIFKKYNILNFKEIKR